MAVKGLLLLAGCLALCYLPCRGHPQCLDSGAPFQPGTSASFCPYSDFGCCSNGTSKAIRLEYRAVRKTVMSVTQGLWKKCKKRVKKLMCERCSPFAAHTFDSGDLVQPYLPGLCRRFSKKLWDSCRDIIGYIVPDSEQYTVERERLVSLIESGNKSAFCDALSYHDPDYCYPEWIKRETEGDFKDDSVTKKGCLCVQELVGGLDKDVVFVVNAGDGSNRLFLGQQQGVVRIFSNDNKTLHDDAFIDISEKLQDIPAAQFSGEQGLLGMCFHPNFTANGRFYLYYTTPEIETTGRQKIFFIRLSEFRTLAGTTDVADAAYERVILSIPQDRRNHNGGQILFGDDGFLYVFIGDGGGARDPSYLAQNLGRFEGKALRIDVDSRTGDRQYGIPADNPFLDHPGALPEIYAYGLRNAWRCGKDLGDPESETRYGKGRIICGDVGQARYEEIDLLQSGGNYGWRVIEGDTCLYEHETDNVCAQLRNESSTIAPLVVYNHTDGKCVIGGEFYRGCAFPNLNGFYFYGDYDNGRMWRLLENRTTGEWLNERVQFCGEDMCTPPFSGEYTLRIFSFGLDEHGEVYIAAMRFKDNAWTSGLYRIVDPYRRGDPSTCPAAGYI